MANVLEVIVTSVEEAREAELGGADRLELVRAFEVGGLTPAAEVVEEVARAVSIPVRVMLRENASMSVADGREIDELQKLARKLGQLPIDGLVVGFAKNGGLDREAMEPVLSAAPGRRATLHRAFEHTDDAIEAIRQAKKMPQIDRILTRGGAGRWPERKGRLLAWQAAAAPEIGLLVGVGLRASSLAEMSAYPGGFEFHVGRAARLPHTTSGAVSRAEVAKLKAVL